MPLDHFTVEDGYAAFRPTGLFTQESLPNATLLDHPPFTQVGRFEFATAMARIWDRFIRVAFVWRPDQKDPEGFGVGENRGLVAGACTSEEEALAWLSSRGGTSREE